MTEQNFNDKAQKLFQRLSNISMGKTHNLVQQNLLQNQPSSFPSHEYNYSSSDKLQDMHKFCLNTNDDIYKSSNIDFTTHKNEGIQSQSGQLLGQLIKYEHKFRQCQQSNGNKIKQMNQKIRKFEQFLHEQNQSRNKINQNFVNSALKIQKNMQLALSNVKKIYLERQKKLQQKIENIVKVQKRKIQDNIEQYANIEQQIHRINDQVRNIHKQLTKMRKNRIQLEDKIYRQFNEQIRSLKTIFQKNVKQRQEKQLRLLGQMKKVYKNQLQNIKNQQITRQGSQRMFLSIIQQLIDKISEA